MTTLIYKYMTVNRNVQIKLQKIYKKQQKLISLSEEALESLKQSLCILGARD